MALPFQPWPSLPLSAEWPLDVLREFYVRPDGSDYTGQGTPQYPYRTPARAVRELQSLGRGIIHLGSGTYTRPLLNGLRGPVVLVGDGGGDPADDGLTEVVAPFAAAAGTGAGVVVGAGFVAGAHRGDAMEVLSGLGAGQRRTIVDNTTTDLVPARNFDPAPAPGDMVRVVVPAVVFAGMDANAFIQKCGTVQGGKALAVEPAGALDVAGVWDGVYLVNLQLAGAAAGASCVLLGSGVHLYGVDLGPNLSNFVADGADLFLGAEAIGTSVGEAQQLAALLGQPATQYAGYTFAPRAVITRFGGTSFVSGYLGGGSGSSINQQCTLEFFGGQHFSQILMGRMGQVQMRVTAAPRCRITRESGAGAGLALNLGGSQANLSAGVQIDVSSGRALDVSRGARAVVDGGVLLTSATGIACSAQQGGAVYIQGSPAGNWVGNGGADDTRVSATEAQAAAFYAAVDATLVAGVGNGSVITRVS